MLARMRDGGMRSTNPKVAPDMAMYWPRVLMMPLGPAPYLKMVVVPGCALVRRVEGQGREAGAAVPKMKPMITPTARRNS